MSTRIHSRGRRAGGARLNAKKRQSRKINWEHGDGRRTKPARHMRSALSCSVLCAALKHVTGPLNPSLSDGSQFGTKDLKSEFRKCFWNQIWSSEGSFLNTTVIYAELNNVFVGYLCVPNIFLYSDWYWWWSTPFYFIVVPHYKSSILLWCMSTYL